jgi:hypothetical protein
MAKNKELSQLGLEFAMAQLDLYWEIICTLDRWLAIETNSKINYWKNEAFSIAARTEKADHLYDEVISKLGKTDGI